MRRRMTSQACLAMYTVHASKACRYMQEGKPHTCSACNEPCACFLDAVCEDAIDADDADLLCRERAAEELAARLEDGRVQHAGLQLVKGNDRNIIDVVYAARYRHPSARVLYCYWTQGVSPLGEEAMCDTAPGEE